MKKVDLDEITSKSIRMQLEKDMGQSLEGFKSFIDEETLLILGQMDPASKVLVQEINICKQGCINCTTACTF